MTIGKKIALGFGLTLALLVAIGGVAAYGTLQLAAAEGELLGTNRVVEETYQVLAKLESVLALLNEAEGGARGFALTGEELYLKPYDEAKSTIDPVLGELKGLTSESAEQQRHLEELRPKVNEKLMFLDSLVEARRTKDTGLDAAVAKMRGNRGQELMTEIRRLMAAMTAEANSRLKEHLDQAKSRDVQAQAAARAALWAIGVGTLLAIVVAAGAGFVTVRSITGPLHRLLDGTEKIGGGMLEHRVNIQSKDEVGDLARAFDRMTEKRHEALTGIREAVARLSSAGAEILASTTQQAAGAQEQAAAVAQTVATVDEVTQTADQAAQRAKGLGEAVHRTLDIGKKGREVVEESIAALERVKEQVEATAGNIMALAEQAQQIGEIIAAVNDVAEQTNLLALNAAIEAARAGEHGKGFAVVAGEVKALADQSKKATAQVRQILGEVQKATNTAVLSTEDVTRGVAAASGVAAQAGETINALAETLGEAAQASAQIGASAGQQATGMAQIHQAMRNIDQVSKQTLAAMRQAEQAAQNLTALGSQLAELSGK